MKTITIIMAFIFLGLGFMGAKIEASPLVVVMMFVVSVAWVAYYGILVKSSRDQNGL